MRQYLLLLLLGVLSGPCLGQSVAVRSGEHENFTRIVVYLPAEMEWKVRRVEEGYRLQLETSAPLEFNLSEVFDFIPRRRIQDVEALGDGLNFYVDCECNATAFEYRPDILVVDVSDGAPEPGSRFEQVLATHEDTRNNESDVLRRGLPTSSPRLPVIPEALDRTRGGSVVGATLEVSPDLRTPLLRQLSNAVSAGLLRAGDGREEVIDFIDQGTTSDTGGAHANSAGVDVRTAIERAGAQRSRDTARGLCLPAELFDVASWGDEGDGFQTVREARSSLVDGNGEVSEEAILRLARAYVHAGFGAEARAILEAYDASAPNDRIVAGIARLVDSPEWHSRSVSSAIPLQRHCSTPAVIWSILASNVGHSTKEETNVDAAQREFGRLPIHLRHRLAPALSARLRALGFRDAANAVRLAAGRAGRAPSEAMALEEAKSSIAPTSAETGILVEVSAGRGSAALQAQTEVLLQLARAGQSLDASLKQTIEAQLKEGIGTTEAKDLHKAYVRALAAGGDHAAALTSLEQMSRSSQAFDYSLPSLLNEFLRHMTRHAGNGEFMVLAPSALQGPLGAEVRPNVRRALRDRIEQLGFEELAQSVLDVGSVSPARIDDAGAANSSGTRFSAPEATYPKNEAERTAALARRGRKLSELGSYVEAARVYERADLPQNAAEAYWRAGRWADAARLLKSEPRQELAAALSGSRSTPIDDVHSDMIVVQEQSQPETVSEIGTSTPEGSGAGPVGVEIPESATAAGGPARNVQGNFGTPTLADASELIAETAAVRTAVETLVLGKRNLE